MPIWFSVLPPGGMASVPQPLHFQAEPAYSPAVQHICNDDPFDQARFNISDHLLETRPIEGRSRNAVVNVKAEVGVPVFKSVLL